MSEFFRYTLTRKFESGEGRMVFVMLNPSTATEFEDDPTIRRCKSFAVRERCKELLVVNLFARRATNPKELPYLYRTDGRFPNMGEESAWHLAFSEESRIIVAAWGAQTGRVGRLVAERLPQVLEAANAHGRIMHALGVTPAGWPRHPLYMRNDALLRPWVCPPLGI